MTCANSSSERDLDSFVRPPSFSGPPFLSCVWLSPQYVWSNGVAFDRSSAAIRDACSAIRQSATVSSVLQHWSGVQCQSSAGAGSVRCRWCARVACDALEFDSINCSISFRSMYCVYCELYSLTILTFFFLSIFSFLFFFSFRFLSRFQNCQLSTLVWNH